MKYIKRYADTLVKMALYSGAVVVEGPKYCGKTQTSMQFAKSAVNFQYDDVQAKIEADPMLLLQGATPRLIDEWQEYPKIWNLIKNVVDQRNDTGQFILTGSSNPEERVKLHSGAGRFSFVRMRTMSSFEREWSTGEVSLADVFMKKDISGSDFLPMIDQWSERICIGGWPGLLKSNIKDSLMFNRDYLLATAQVDLSRVSNTRRDPQKITRLLSSLARNISTEATNTALAKDTKGAIGQVSDETVAEYVNALERLMLVENLPAWSAKLRSSAILRKAPKRHFVDPSLAVGALGLTPEKLSNDLNYLGMLFESMVIRDLRVYSQINEANVFHYRDSHNNEVDAIIEKTTGEYIAIEIKLGFGAVDTAVANLKNFRKNIDTNTMSEPQAMVVITGSGFPHRRKDGIYVIPIQTLKA